MMESCRRLHSSLHRSRYVSWCVDSAESQTPVNTTQPATGATPHTFSQQHHQPAASEPIPLLLLSPPETGEEDSFSHQQPQRIHHEAFTHSHHTSSALHSTDTATTSHSDGGKEDDSGEGSKDNNKSEEKPPPLHPENETFHLPRSSPVISRRHRPVSWHGAGADASNPTSLDSPSPASSSLPRDQHGRLAVGSMEDLGSRPSSHHLSPQVQEDKKQRFVSVSNLNNLLVSLFHLPFSGQQGLTGEHRGQGLTSCDGRRSPDLSTPTQNSREGRCSGIPEFSADIFQTSCELDKENAHFIVVDMVLEVLEGAKWNLSFDRTSTMDTHRHTDYETCTDRHTSSAEDRLLHEHEAFRHTQGCGTSDARQENNKCRHVDEDVNMLHVNTHTSENAQTQQDAGHTQDREEEDAGNEETKHQQKTFSVLSTDSGFEDCGGDITLTQKDCLRNAESLAQQLVMEFRRSWLPSRELRYGRLSLLSSLQELPGTGSVAASSSSLTEEIRLRTRMRGSLSWAPPRFQIIFTVQPTRRRSEVVTSQNFLCAGCGTKVEPRYIKKLRYCEYLGRYFCDCCHSGSEAVIPGRVLSCWDFGRYPVSDFSKQLLESVWHQPLFDLTCVGKTLYGRVKELEKFRELQEQLLSIKKLLKACRLSERVMMELEQLPAHLMEQPHLFSIDDLWRVKKGQLVVQARAVLHTAMDHVENCKLCLARGFICEFCRDRDIIFPFQTDICKRCPVCKTCYHKQCLVGKKCLKCARIQSRKKHSDGSVK